MRERLIAAVVLAVAVGGGLWVSGSDTGAKANRGNYAVYGWVYGVTSVDAWEKSLPSGKADQDRYDKDMMQQTHYVFEASSDPARYHLNMQQALHHALNDGWQVVNVESGKVLMHHPKRQVYDRGRDGGRK